MSPFLLAALRGGAPQSRGYGFVEFRHHAHALACLRELNNNSEYGRKHAQGGAGPVGKACNLIVEFSVENMQKVSHMPRGSSTYILV